MPALHEIDAVNKPDDWANLISIVESDKTPFTSMIRKKKEPNQVVHRWQAKKFPDVGFNGVLDGKDATEFNATQAEELTGVAQKVWYNIGVSDFMEEMADVAGISGSHFNYQISEGVKVLSRMIEKRALSNEDVSRDDGVSNANETRGIFKWSDNSFDHAAYAPPVNFQTPAGNKYSGDLSAFDEESFRDMGVSSYKQRKGPAKMDGFLGIELKNQFTEFTSYQKTESAKTPVRRFNFGEGSTLNVVVDRLVLDSGTYDLHTSSFIKCDPVTGEDTADTHKSGIFIDMDMVGLAYTRMPRVKKLEYQGGGHKAIIDAIFMLCCDNPLTLMPLNINS
jgi:hypothetical protein